MLHSTRTRAFTSSSSCQVPRRLLLSRTVPQRCVIADASLKDTPFTLVMEKGELAEFPEQPAVYAVYNKDDQIQYIGLTRKINVTVSNHLRDVPESTAAVRYELLPDASRDALTGAWKAWMEEALAATGGIPPGNAPGETKWQSRSAKPKADVKLTAGKAINVPIETLIDQVVKANKVVAFIKGTRSTPQCGFSYKMLSILNDMRTDYEVVNVLDDFHNPGLREAIKEYSQWPTIPQLYIGGEFVGGSDIVEQMVGNGELQLVLRGESK
ncbi:CGFS type glutaredoxin [Scenedesmus sp. NREL 46B-D3]|nr:CGFS type glutaredoxin [Scenedesmus sp. NREL 46B-D3]